MRLCTLTAIATLGGVLSLAVPAQTQAQDGLSFLHATVRIGNRICMADHFHSGTGSGPTQRHAVAAAARDWAGFTAWEYGPQWGIWSLAETKRASCNGGRGAPWTCTVEARPCKQVGR